MKSYISLFFGALLVALSLNLVLIPNDMISFGVDGLASLLYYMTDVNPAINMLICNFILLLITSLLLDKNVLKMYVLPAILIPFLVFITSPISNYFTIEFPENMLIIIVGSVLSAYGYSFIYKQGYSGGTVFLIDEIMGKLTKFYSKMYSWIIDICTIIISFNLFGFEKSFYSLIIIMISRYLITKVRLGINDSKMFYIITSKEKEVKNFIIHDLKYELTVLDVKGGFSKKENQILLTVISSNDYFKLKEGIKIIDPKAFIAITETYDVLNRKSF